MLTKLQIVFGILALMAIIVFFFAVVTNAQVKQPGPVPDWLGLVVWGAFGLIMVCALGTIVTQVLEYREPKEKKIEEEEVAEEEAPAEELAAVGAAAEGEAASEGEATAEEGIVSEGEAATAFEPAGEGSVETEIASTGDEPEQFANFEDFTDLPDLDDELK